MYCIVSYHIISYNIVSYHTISYHICNQRDYILSIQITGPENPTSQLLPKMSFNGFSGDREGRKDKGGGERSRRYNGRYECIYVCR